VQFPSEKFPTVWVPIEFACKN